MNETPTTQLRFEVDSDFKDEIQAHADRYRISLADSARILLRKGLETATVRDVHRENMRLRDEIAALKEETQNARTASH